MPTSKRNGTRKDLSQTLRTIDIRLGFGRIEIFTKPGTEKFRGETSVSAGTQRLASIV